VRRRNDNPSTEDENIDNSRIVEYMNYFVDNRQFERNTNTMNQLVVKGVFFPA
jgi:hypothetical protein